jgi:hypothetical protein
MHFLWSFLIWGATLATAQTPPPTGPQTRVTELHIRILDLDNAILSTRQRVSREGIVQVEDENRKPVAGVLLSFNAPTTGPSAVFGDGRQFATLVSDDRGQVVLRGIRPNSLPGDYTVRITASKDGISANAELHLKNAVAPPPAPVVSAKVIIAIVAGAAVAAGAGIYAAKSGSGSSGGVIGGAPGQPTALTLQLGTPSVGGPH